MSDCSKGLPSYIAVSCQRTATPIALLDPIEDFQVYWRREGSESRQHLVGTRVIRWQGRRARLV
jgi:hypothetical protein